MLQIAIAADVLGNSRASPRAAALLRSFHERHVPLTPRLAEALSGLEARNIPTEAPFWGRAFLLAGETVGMPTRFGNVPFWRRAVPAFAGTVAEPILRRATMLAGAMRLGGAAELGPPADADCDARLEAAADRLLAGVEGMGRGFWINAALGLHAAALAPPGDLRPAPAGEPVLAQLLFETEPRMPDEEQQLRRRKIAPQRALRRSGIRPKEGGVAGVRISSMDEDLPDALLTEFLLPDELLADRLLHEGFVVRHRPPQREPRRDLLALALCDRRQASAGTLVAKAAWADAALRLRIALAQMGLNRSDIGWSEAAARALRCSLLPVDGHAAPAAANPFALSGALRAETLMTSGLLPDLVARDPLPTDGLLSMGAGDPVWQGLLQHSLQRLRAPVGAATKPGRKPEGPKRSEPARPETLSDYGKVLLLLMLDESSAEGRAARESWAGLRGRVTMGLRGLVPQGTKIVALLCPAMPDRDTPFVLVGDLSPGEGSTLALPEAEDPSEATSELLGSLSAALIGITIEALHAR